MREEKKTIFRKVLLFLLGVLVTVWCIPVVAWADLDLALTGDTHNTFIGCVNGEQTVFYLSKTSTASDGYEVSFISFTEAGEPQYKLYMRIALLTSAGTYSNNQGGLDASYFSISTRYVEESGKWADSYRVVEYSTDKEDGVYRLTLNNDMNRNVYDCSGTFEAEMNGCSKATKGKTISITDGVFEYTKREVHEVVAQYMGSSSGSHSSSVNDDLASGNISNDSGSAIEIDHTCRTCKGTGRCTVCDGIGRKESKSTGKWVDCIRCSGSGKCSVCSGTGKVY